MDILLALKCIFYQVTSRVLSYNKCLFIKDHYRFNINVVRSLVSLEKKTMLPWSKSRVIFSVVHLMPFFIFRWNMSQETLRFKSLILRIVAKVNHRPSLWGLTWWGYRVRPLHSRDLGIWPGGLLLMNTTLNHSI